MFLSSLSHSLSFPLFFLQQESGAPLFTENYPSLFRCLFALHQPVKTTCYRSSQGEQESGEMLHAARNLTFYFVTRSSVWESRVERSSSLDTEWFSCDSFLFCKMHNIKQQPQNKLTGTECAGLRGKGSSGLSFTPFGELIRLSANWKMPAAKALSTLGQEQEGAVTSQPLTWLQFGWPM